MKNEELFFSFRPYRFWHRTFIVRLRSIYGLVPLAFSLFSFAQQLLLEVSHCLQEIFALYVRGWNHDAAVQEFIDTIQEVLPVISKVGHLVEVLQQNRTGCQQWNHKDRPYKLKRKTLENYCHDCSNSNFHFLKLESSVLACPLCKNINSHKVITICMPSSLWLTLEAYISYLPCPTWEWQRSVRSHGSPHWIDWGRAEQREIEQERGSRAPTPGGSPRSAWRRPWQAAPKIQHSLKNKKKKKNILSIWYILAQHGEVGTIIMKIFSCLNWIISHMSDGLLENFQ